MARSGDNGRSGRPRVARFAASAPSVLAASAALCGISFALLLTRHRMLAGVAALLAAVCLVAGTTRARAGGSRDVLFAELIVDRVFDASILAPLVWVWRVPPSPVVLLSPIGPVPALHSSS